MNRPSADDVRREPAGRQLDAWVAEYACGWSEVRGEYPFDQEPDFRWRGVPPGWKLPTPIPHYSTDPAASAELRRHLWASGRYDKIAVEYRTDRVRVFPTRNSMGPLVDEPVTGDPVAAEMLAWAKAAVLSVLDQ